MTDPTTPPVRPFPGPCAAVRCEDPAVYGAGAAHGPQALAARLAPLPGSSPGS